MFLFLLTAYGVLRRRAGRGLHGRPTGCKRIQADARKGAEYPPGRTLTQFISF